MEHLNIPVTTYASKVIENLDQNRIKSRGYSAGCGDWTDVTSSFISIAASTKPINVVGEYVVVLYGPKFYIGQILEVDSETNDFLFLVMSLVTRNEYKWISEGDTGYEDPYW